MPKTRNVTAEDYDPRSRFGLYRLCDCPTCKSRGQVRDPGSPPPSRVSAKRFIRCPDCRGEGRIIRQEVASCESPEAVGVALVTLGREKEWEGCAFGLLDREPECETCNGSGKDCDHDPCSPLCVDCRGEGVKPTGTWLLLPWLPSARNVTDAARTLAKSKKRST